MNYPVMITKEEFEEATGIVLASLFAEEETTLKINKFLKDISFYTFENAIYPAGQRHRVDAIIQAYPETVQQIKNILYKVGEYMLSNENIGLYAGMEMIENGSVELKDTQEIISKILPPNIMTYVMNIRPNIVYAGGIR